MGDEKKLRIWLLISRWKKQNRTNTIMVNDSNALEKKSDTIIMIIRIKMTVCVHLIIIGSFCNLFSIVLYLTPALLSTGGGEVRT